MNIFTTLTTYKPTWNLKSTREFSEEELNYMHPTAEVVEGQWGLNVKFTSNEGVNYIALSSDSALGVGEEVEVKNLLLQTFEQGEKECIKVIEK